MAKRKHVHHGSKRKVRKALTLGGTGAQAVTITPDADLYKIATDPCTATTLTVSVTDMFDGASILIDFDSNVACDTFTIQADDGTGDTVLASGTFDDNARSLIKVDVLDSTKGAAVLAVTYTTIA